MTDKEKIIKGLECCLGSNDCDIDPREDCPYNGMCLCAMALRLDVLNLLKEQDNCENCAIAIEDRQPVVRCKNCKWYDKQISICNNCGLPREQTFFCADGINGEVE